MLNRTATPYIYSPIEFDFNLPPCNLRTLDNGIPMYYVNEGVEDVMQLELVFPAGLWYEAQRGVAQTTTSLLKSGTSKLNSYAINELFEQYGANIKAGAGNDWASVSISCMTRHLPKILPLVVTLFTDTQFPQEEIDIYVQNAKQRLSVQLKKSDFVANRLIDEYLVGRQHPYGKYMDASDYDLITQATLKDYLKKNFNSKSCKMFMAGKFSDQDIELVNTVFGSEDWNEANDSTPTYDAVSTLQKQHKVIQDEHGVQGSIRLIRNFPEKTHPDFTEMIVLNTVFGGYFGSRLMSNIREDKGYTYGIHSYLYNNIRNGAYLITTEAGKDVCDATLKEIYYEMDVLKQELIDDEELLLVKNYLLGTLLGDLDGAFQIIQRWKNLILNNFTEERFNNNINVYKSITAPELQALAQKYLNKEDFYELVVI